MEEDLKDASFDVIIWWVYMVCPAWTLYVTYGILLCIVMKVLKFARSLRVAMCGHSDVLSIRTSVEKPEYKDSTGD